MSEVVWRKRTVETLPAVHRHPLHAVWEVDVEDGLAVASFELSCHECDEGSLDWFELPADEMYEACRAYCAWYEEQQRRRPGAPAAHPPATTP